MKTFLENKQGNVNDFDESIYSLPPIETNTVDDLSKKAALFPPPPPPPPPGPPPQLASSCNLTGMPTPAPRKTIVPPPPPSHKPVARGELLRQIQSFGKGDLKRVELKRTTSQPISSESDVMVNDLKDLIQRIRNSTGDSDDSDNNDSEWSDAE